MTLRLPDSELEVLKTIWKLGGKATAKEIRQKLKPPRDHATVSTLLKRLGARELVTREKSDEGREFVYEATAKPEKTQRSLVKDLLQRAFDGSGIDMVNALFQTKPPTDSEIAEIEDLLKELKKNKRTKKVSK